MFGHLAFFLINESEKNWGLIIRPLVDNDYLFWIIILLQGMLDYGVWSSYRGGWGCPREFPKSLKGKGPQYHTVPVLYRPLVLLTTSKIRSFIWT